MNERIKIGYQGVHGSYSESASQKLAKQLDLLGVEYVGLVTSQAVVQNLLMGRIDYGVLAVRNNLGGEVAETYDALAGRSYQIDGLCDMQIKHCLYVLDRNVQPDSVVEVASHEQALKQCERYLKQNYPNAKITKALDTALSAQQLRSGQLGKNVAVVCSKKAGELNGLALMKENINDEKSSTTFIIISKIS